MLPVSSYLEGSFRIIHIYITAASPGIRKMSHKSYMHILNDKFAEADQMMCRFRQPGREKSTDVLSAEYDTGIDDLAGLDKREALPLSGISPAREGLDTLRVCYAGRTRHAEFLLIGRETHGTSLCIQHKPFCHIMDNIGKRVIRVATEGDNADQRKKIFQHPSHFGCKYNQIIYRSSG